VRIQGHGADSGKFVYTTPMLVTLALVAVVVLLLVGTVYFAGACERTLRYWWG
jgi:hypothetical protein